MTPTPTREVARKIVRDWAQVKWNNAPEALEEAIAAALAAVRAETQHEARIEGAMWALEAVRDKQDDLMANLSFADQGLFWANRIVADRERAGKEGK